LILLKNLVINFTMKITTEFEKFLLEVYDELLETFGPQHWWPGDTPLEIAIGAILTQNTNWRNVEKAIKNLKMRDLIDVDSLYSLPCEELSHLIKPSGFFNVKTKRLKSFIKFLKDSGGLEKLKHLDVSRLRKSLLEVSGIGKETADSIILYALEKPIFVVDAYTRRFLIRHGIISGNEEYDDIRQLFESSLPNDVDIYKEYHALIVKLGKVYCKTKPICEGCPLNKEKFWRFMR